MLRLLYLLVVYMIDLLVFANYYGDGGKVWCRRNAIATAIITICGFASARLLASVQGNPTGWGIFGPIFISPFLCTILIDAWHMNRSKGYNTFAMLLIISIAVARMLCFINGCCLGKVICGNLRFPTREAELIFDGIAFISFAKKIKKGTHENLLGRFITEYGVFRFFIEFIRDEPELVHLSGVFGIHTAHIFAIIAIVEGLIVQRAEGTHKQVMRRAMLQLFAAAFLITGFVPAMAETASVGASASPEPTDSPELSETGQEEPVTPVQTDNDAANAAGTTPAGSVNTHVDNVPPSSGSSEGVPESTDVSDMSENGEYVYRLLVIPNDAASIRPSDTIISQYDDLYMLGFATKDALDSALAYYEPNSSFAEIDADVYAAEGSTEPESDDPTTVMSGESNPLDQLTEESAKEEGAEDTSAVAAVKEDYTIALIDTGASVDGEHVLSAVSMIGNNPEDDNGHGTQMVSFITEEDPNAYIISIKALDSEGVGSISSIYAGMEYAIDHKANIINLSLSAVATAENSLLEKEVEKAHDQGITVVGAAGNDNNDASYYVPGNIEQALIVGSANEDGTRRDGSNYGDTVDYNIVSSSTSEAAARMSGIISARKITESTFAKVDFDYLVSTHVIYPTSETSAVSFLPGFEMFDGLFKAQAVTVTYNTNGGQFSDGTTSKAVTDGSIPSDPTRSNYHFRGWYTAATGGTDIKSTSSYSTGCGSPTYKPSANQTVYAQWDEIKKYTLTFNTNGGSSGDTLVYSVLSGAKYSTAVTTVPSATRDGYTFVGWGSTSTSVDYDNSSTMPYHDVTYYAVWIAQSATVGSCQITIDDDGNTIVGTDSASCTIDMASAGAAWDNYRKAVTSIKFKGTVTLKASSTSSGFNKDTPNVLGNFSKLISVDMENCVVTDSSGAQTYAYLFYNDNNLKRVTFNNDTSNVISMRSMFGICDQIESLDLSGFNTSKVTDMSDMFYDCFQIESLNLSGFDTSKVTTMSGMFQCCDNLSSLNISKFDTSSVTSMAYMFATTSLSSPKLTSLDLSSFDTSNVTTMYFMFGWQSRLKTLDLSNFDTGKVRSMNSMFSGCSSLTNLNISSFNTSQVTDMGLMFNQCSALTNINCLHFNTEKVTNMERMFALCSSLTTLDLSSFDTSAVTNMSEMFNETTDTWGNTVSRNAKLSKITISSSFKVAATHSNMFPTPTVTASGKVSDGTWGLGSEMAETTYSASDLPANFTTGTWYAQATTSYTVSFNANGGSGTTASVMAYYGSAMPSITNGMNRTGYTFAGYYDAASGGTQYYTASSASARTFDKTSDTTLYAQWTANTYTIVFNGNGSTSGSTANESMTYDTAKTLTGNGFVRDGYIFDSWNTKADGTGTSYFDGQKVANLTSAAGATVTLYAQWGHWVFDSWNTSADGSGATYKIGSALPDSNLDLYAQWRYEHVTS